MKKIIFLSVISLFCSTAFASVVNDVTTLEQATTLDQDDMYLINYYQDLLWWIAAACPSSDIESAKVYVWQIQKSLEKQYAPLSQWQILNETITLHDHLLSLQPRLAQIWWQHFCTLKYILYAMQDWLRDKHVALMETTGIIRDFDGFVLGWPVHWADVKLELMDTYIDELADYETRLGQSINFQQWWQLVTDSEVWRQIWDKSTRIMQLTVYKALVSLKEAWLFTDADINELNWKFLLNMHLSCNSFHGNYKVTETLDHRWSHVSYKTEEVPLDVNACGNYFLIKELPFHFYKIVVHELGHHFYYYHDREWNDNFEAICRSWNTCSVNDYVSSYAQSNAIEDYAEHFMHRFLDIAPPVWAKWAQKTMHFDNLRN